MGGSVAGGKLGFGCADVFVACSRVLCLILCVDSVLYVNAEKIVILTAVKDRVFYWINFLIIIHCDMKFFCDN